MKIGKILFSILTVSACTSAAYATKAPNYPQLYLGAQGGYVDTNFSLSNMKSVSTGNPLSSANIKNHVFGARGYAGIQFNDFVAVEGGYLRPRNTRFTNAYDSAGNLVQDGDVSEYGLDLTGKVFLPMAAYVHLNPYLKVGLEYMDGTSHGGVTRNGAYDFGYSLHPLFGAGIGYYLTDYLTVDLSWTTITKHNSQLPALYLYFLGLTYRFSPGDLASGPPNYGDVHNDDP